MTDTMYFETIDLFPTYHDIRKTSDLMDKLTIDLNTQHFWVEIERVKRQKMRLLMRHLRNKMAPADRIVDQLRQEVALLTQKMGSLTEAYNGEIARLSTVTYRCFSILHQILITIDIDYKQSCRNVTANLRIITNHQSIMPCERSP